MKARIRHGLDAPPRIGIGSGTGRARPLRWVPSASIGGMQWAVYNRRDGPVMVGRVASTSGPTHGMD